MILPLVVIGHCVAFLLFWTSWRPQWGPPPREKVQVFGQDVGQAQLVADWFEQEMSNHQENETNTTDNETFEWWYQSETDPPPVWPESLKQQLKAMMGRPHPFTTSITRTTTTIETTTTTREMPVLPKCEYGDEKRSRKTFCAAMPVVHFASPTPWLVGEEFFIRICSPYSVPDSAFRVFIMGYARDSSGWGGTLLNQTVISEPIEPGTHGARFVVPPVGHYEITIRPQTFKVTSHLTSECTNPDYNWEGANRKRAECQSPVVCGTGTPENRYLQNFEVIAEHHLYAMAMFPHRVKHGMDWLPPNDNFMNGPLAGQLKPPCRLTSGPIPGMWVGGEFAPHACKLKREWTLEDIPKKMSQHHVAKILFVGDGVMLKFCAAMRDLVCGDRDESQCQDRDNKPFQSMTFRVRHRLNITCFNSEPETVRAKLKATDSFDMVVINKGASLALIGCPLREHEDYLERELSAWEALTVPKIGRFVWASSGSPMEWKLSKWKYRYCHFGAALLEHYFRTEVRVVARHRFMFFDMHSISASRDDWHSSGDPVHYNAEGYDRLVHLFFELFLAQ